MTAASTLVLQRAAKPGHRDAHEAEGFGELVRKDIDRFFPDRVKSALFAAHAGLTIEVTKQSYRGHFVELIHAGQFVGWL